VSWLIAVVLAAGPNPFLAEALEHEKNLDFEKCISRLQQAATQWKSSTTELRDIELHAGLCNFNLGQKKAAAEHFRTALRIDEGADLPPYTSPKAVELFVDVKKTLRAPAPPLPESDLPEEKDLTPKPKTTVPDLFGLTLARRAAPLTLGLVTIGAAIAGIALGARAQNVAAQANASRFESDFFRLGDDARGLAIASTLSWVISALAATATGLTWWLTSDPRQGP
jgi:hypothetical protein